MQEVSRDIFYQTIRNWEDVPFTQTDGYVRLQSGDDSSRVRYFLDEHIGCAAHVKRFAGLTMLMIDTECLQHKQTKPATYSRFYEALQQTGVDMIETNSHRPYEAEYEIGMRQAGFLRPVGSFSFEQTNQVDLTQPLGYNENWRRNIRQSDQSDLSLQCIGKPTDADIEDFLRLFREMCAHKHLSVPFTGKGLRILLSDPAFRLCFIVRGEERLSGIIYHHVRSHAGLLYAANGDEANRMHAGFQLYKQLLTRLAAEGVASFDMEKMAPSTHSSNAVFLFKQGIRGELLPLCGEWSWYRRGWYGVGMYFVKKYLWRKVQA
jgi:hypothetical protein